MSMTSTANFFSGWLGFGTAFAANALSEPSDQAYARRTVVLSPLFNGRAQDTIPGTIGPATQNWNALLFGGLFDAATGGDLLAVWPLPRPIVLSKGQTWTSNGDFSLVLDGDPALSPLATRSWIAGGRIGVIGGFSVVTACQNLQLSGGQLSMTGGSSLSNGSSLPSAAPASGSGQLWNNGGVICIA